MIYTDFGTTGAKVSRLGLGAMRLPITKDASGKISGLDESAAIVRHAIDKGINYIDTALFYVEHNSEVAVGRGIKGVPRESFYLSTKNPVQNTCGSCFRLRLELSLAKLQTPYIDFYHFWGLSWDSYQTFLADDGPLAAARKAKEEGLIKHISFSSHDSAENVIKLIDTGNFESMLVQYNLLDRGHSDSLAHAHSKGMGTVVMGPVAGGRLGTKSEMILSATGASSTAEAALRFVWANPNVNIALSGMSTIEQIDENTATAARAEPLTADEIARIDQLAADNKAMLDLPCTGCGYCRECPEGVAIDKVFQYYQWHSVFGMVDAARKSYAKLGTGWMEKHKPASCCKKCGQCEPKCPQKIAIVKKLKEAHKILAE